MLLVVCRFLPLSVIFFYLLYVTLVTVRFAEQGEFRFNRLVDSLSAVVVLLK